MGQVISERANGRRRVSYECEGESKTEQSHAAACNISTIMSRAARAGVVPQYPGRATYGDFTSVVDYQTALEAVRAADREFMKLPAVLRDRFGQDPGKVVDFLSDPANEEEAIRLGLIKKPPPAASEVSSEASGEAGATAG